MATLKLKDKKSGESFEVQYDGTPSKDVLRGILKHHRAESERAKFNSNPPGLPKVNLPEPSYLDKFGTSGAGSSQPGDENLVNADGEVGDRNNRATLESTGKSLLEMLKAPYTGATKDIPAGWDKLTSHESSFDERLGGAAQLGSGALKVASPLLAYGAIRNPGVAARILPLSDMTSKASGNLARTLGAGPGTQSAAELAGSLTGPGEMPVFQDPQVIPKSIESGVVNNPRQIESPRESLTPRDIKVDFPGPKQIGAAPEIKDPTYKAGFFDAITDGVPPGPKVMPPGDNSGVPLSAISQYNEGQPPVASPELPKLFPDYPTDKPISIDDLVRPTEESQRVSRTHSEPFDPVVAYYDTLDKIEQSSGKDDDAINIAIQGAKANKIGPEQLSQDLMSSGMDKVTAMSRAYSSYAPGEYVEPVETKPVELPKTADTPAPTKPKGIKDKVPGRVPIKTPSAEVVAPKFEKTTKKGEVLNNTQQDLVPAKSAELKFKVGDEVVSWNGTYGTVISSTPEGIHLKFEDGTRSDVGKQGQTYGPLYPDNFTKEAIPVRSKRYLAEKAALKDSLDGRVVASTFESSGKNAFDIALKAKADGKTLKQFQEEVWKEVRARDARYEETARGVQVIWERADKLPKEELTLQQKIELAKADPKNQQLINPKEARARRREVNKPLQGGVDKKHPNPIGSLLSKIGLGSKNPNVSGPGSATPETPKGLAIYPKGVLRALKYKVGQTHQILRNSEDPYSARIGYNIPRAEDLKQKWLAGKLREVEPLMKGLSSQEKKTIFAILDHYAEPLQMRATKTVGPKIIERAAQIREYLDAIRDEAVAKGIKTRAGKDIGHIDSYITHIMQSLAEDPDQFAGAGQIFDFFLNSNYNVKKALQGMYTTDNPQEEIRLTEGDAADVSNQFFEQRRMNDPGYKMETDIEKVLLAYTHLSARGIFDKPAIENARKMLPAIENTFERALAKGYLKNYSRYDANPEFNNVYNALIGTTMQMYADSVLGLNSKLFALHLARTGFVFSDLDTKYFAYGAMQLSNPVKAYQEVASLGLLPGMITPYSLQNARGQIRSVQQLAYTADFIPTVIGYYGFYKKYLDQGLPPAEAQIRAIGSAKEADQRVSPGRSAELFQNLTAGARLFAQFKQTPQAILEKIARNIYNWKAEPAKAARTVFAVGMMMLISYKKGIAAWHLGTSQLDLGGGALGTIIKDISLATKLAADGDVEGASQKLLLLSLITVPGGLAIYGQARKGIPSFIEDSNKFNDNPTGLKLKRTIRKTPKRKLSYSR